MIVRIQGVSEIHNKIYYEYDTDSIPFGEGGMGIVYPGKCFKQDNPNEYIPVAIKLITNTSQEMIERAMRESSIQIDHPNLLLMYGFIPNMEMDPFTQQMKPKYYIVMEALDGVSLESMLQGVFYAKNGSDIEYARNLYNLYVQNRKEFTLQMMRPILSGVERLHQAGFIHRDIDPSNVMITREGNVKIIDYGVCKPISAAGGGARLTMSGSIIGKVDYAAPELLTGDIQHHNFTTDIYALGILLFQLYTGALPFVGDNAAVMKAQLNEKVPVDKVADPKIRKVIAKATEKMQQNRYQSVSEMCDALYASDVVENGQPEVDRGKAETISANTVHKKETQETKVPANDGASRNDIIAMWTIAGVLGLIAGVIFGFII